MDEQPDQHTPRAARTARETFAASRSDAPAIIADAGPNAGFAWEEFFQGEIANAHTRKNYIHAVRKFLAWAEAKNVELLDITPGLVGKYFQELDVAVPTKKLHLAALRKFFDRLVNRHAIYINPAATVRAERYSMVEGKTPEIQRKQAETLIKSIETTYVDKSEIRPDLVGLRDRAILAVLAYTAARVGAVAKLTFKSLRHDGTQYALRFSEKGGKSREIPVRADLQKIILAYVEAAGITDGPLFRTAAGKTRQSDREPDDRHRHLPHDEAPPQGGRPARRVFAPFFPGHDRDRPARAKHVPGRRAVPGRPRRSADHPPLRPPAAQGHAEHRRAHLDQHRSGLTADLVPELTGSRHRTT